MTDVWSERAEAFRESPTHKEGPDLDLLVEWCEPGEGVQALDVATGGGHVARRLQEAGCDVVSVDPAPGMRPTVIAPAEHLPFADGSFDAVVAQLVIQLMGDRDAGVREMARVTRAGGVLAACVWDSGNMPLLRSFWDAALDAAPERAGAIDDGRRVGYDSPSELGALFEACGLTDVATGELLVGADYEDFDELWEPFSAGIGHSGGCFTSLEPGRRIAVRSDVHRRLGSPEGPFRLTARAWWARGIVG